jgi:hypothetical protein
MTLAFMRVVVYESAGVKHEGYTPQAVTAGHEDALCSSLRSDPSTEAGECARTVANPGEPPRTERAATESVDSAGQSLPLPAELLPLVRKWPTLHPDVRRAILSIVEGDA